MTPIERAAAAVIADLRRQSETSGCAVDDNGRLAQVDGSFQVEPLVRAVLEAIREPSDAMVDRGTSEMPYDDDHGVDREMRAKACWDSMIDAALAEGQ